MRGGFAAKRVALLLALGSGVATRRANVSASARDAGLARQADDP